MTVHSSYIAVSEFFQTALKKEWAEGQTRTIKLPSEKAELVAQYLDWVYGKGLPTRNTKNDCQKGDVYDVLTELYGLGERLLDSTLRNAIVKEMVRFTKLGGPIAETQWLPNSTATNTIYECTTATSPVRRLLVDLFVIKGKPDWVNDDLHIEFYRDLSKASLSELHASALGCRARVVQSKDYFV